MSRVSESVDAAPETAAVKEKKKPPPPQDGVETVETGNVRMCGRGGGVCVWSGVPRGGVAV